MTREGSWYFSDKVLNTTAVKTDGAASDVATDHAENTMLRARISTRLFRVGYEYVPNTYTVTRTETSTNKNDSEHQQTVVATPKRKGAEQNSNTGTDKRQR